jgi:hypothetical protein
MTILFAAGNRAERFYLFYIFFQLYGGKPNQLVYAVQPGVILQTVYPGASLHLSKLLFLIIDITAGL